jgi:hypothetical protein
MKLLLKYNFITDNNKFSQRLAKHSTDWFTVEDVLENKSKREKIFRLPHLMNPQQRFRMSRQYSNEE